MSKAPRGLRDVETLRRGRRTRRRARPCRRRRARASRLARTARAATRANSRAHLARRPRRSSSRPAAASSFAASPPWIGRGRGRHRRALRGGRVLDPPTPTTSPPSSPPPPSPAWTGLRPRSPRSRRAASSPSPPPTTPPTPRSPASLLLVVADVEVQILEVAVHPTYAAAPRRAPRPRRARPRPRRGRHPRGARVQRRRAAALRVVRILSGRRASGILRRRRRRGVDDSNAASGEREGVDAITRGFEPGRCEETRAEDARGDATRRYDTPARLSVGETRFPKRRDGNGRGRGGWVQDAKSRKGWVPKEDREPGDGDVVVANRGRARLVRRAVVIFLNGG